MRIDAVRTRDIGGRTFPAIGQGGMAVGGRFSPDHSRDDEQIAALRYGLECGMTFIDTAEIYGDGHSEELIGRAIAGVRDRVFLGSKVSPEHLRATDLIHACERSLARLGTDHLDLYQIHWPNPAVAVAESLDALERLARDGKVLHIGVSNFSLAEVREAEALLCSHRLFSVQVEYNLCERGPERDLIPYCAERGLLVIAYSPLDQGRVAGSAPIRRVLAEVARECGRTPSQVALNFLANQGPVIPIPKALGRAHIEQNAAACDFTLSPALRARIDEECWLEAMAIPWETIRPALDMSGEHTVYRTLAEARANPKGLSPAPEMLAGDIRKDDRIKPIRVVALEEPAGNYSYDLVEGRLRFWAWVIAFDGQRAVPALVRN